MLVIKSMHQYGIHPWNPDKALSNELTNKTSNAIPNPTYIFNSSCKKLFRTEMAHKKVTENLKLRGNFN